MNSILQLVDSLETKLGKLLSKYELLQIENRQLLEKSEKLVQEVQRNQEALQEMEQQYESLKIANAIVGSKEDKHATKLKINTLIREIDKCIMQLSE